MILLDTRKLQKGMGCYLVSLWDDCTAGVRFCVVASSGQKQLTLRDANTGKMIGHSFPHDYLNKESGSNFVSTSSGMAHDIGLALAKRRMKAAGKPAAAVKAVDYHELVKMFHANRREINNV